jgi:serine/threonine protein kinase
MELVPGQVAFGGRYRVESILHAGPRSVVVAATSVAHENQRVAIKVPRPALTRDPVAMQRFIASVMFAAKLRGDHSIRVFDLGMSDVGPYFVMELLDGTDLATTLSSGKLIEPARAVDLLLQVCEALAEMHAIQFVHRNIEPANLIVSRRDGQSWLTIVDFFFARSFDKTTRLMRTEASLGSRPTRRRSSFASIPCSTVGATCGPSARSRASPPRVSRRSRRRRSPS